MHEIKNSIHPILILWQIGNIKLVHYLFTYQEVFPYLSPTITPILYSYLNY
jgi:hypothetical protein